MIDRPPFINHVYQRNLTNFVNEKHGPPPFLRFSRIHQSAGKCVNSGKKPPITRAYYLGCVLITLPGSLSMRKLFPFQSQGATPPSHNTRNHFKHAATCGYKSFRRVKKGNSKVAFAQRFVFFLLEKLAAPGKPEKQTKKKPRRKRKYRCTYLKLIFPCMIN